MIRGRKLYKRKLYKREFYKRKRSLKGQINLFLCSLIIFGVFPVFITSFFGRMELENLFFQKPESSITEIEARLPQIVAKQINIHMPDELIKAQSVIARTQLMAAEEKGEALPAEFTVLELQELWGDQYENYYQKLQELVEATAGETIQCNGNYIYAAYHQVSAGNTRTMSEYYEKSEMPYLAGTACHEDTAAEGYLNVYFWTKEEFVRLCKNAFPEEEISGGNDIQIQKRDSAGYVLQVQAGQTIYEGENFRKKLNLPSACFELTLLDEDVRIVTMGQGHGFGLSQHMAQILAEEGKTYREILEYFYKGIAITE